MKEFVKQEKHHVGIWIVAIIVAVVTSIMLFL